MAKATDEENGGAHAATLAGAETPSFEPLIELSNKLLEAWMAVGAEILDFGRMRLDQSLEMSKALAKSSSFNEAMEVQAQFSRSIMQDYFSKANKIADLSTRGLMDGFSAMQKGARRAATTYTQAAE